MAANIHINLNDKPGMAHNARTGLPGILGNAYPTPPGVTDDLWRRLLNVADTQVRRYFRDLAHTYTGDELDALKFRKALKRLLEVIHEACPTGTIKQQALHSKRVHLPPQFFMWVMGYGYEIDRATWAFHLLD